MRNISSIYAQYEIMPNLREHQLRVAAVAKVICDNSHVPVDAKTVIEACLLHDMGNILKFDLERFPQFTEKLGLPYWQGVKEKFRSRYGDDEHKATDKIGKELGVSHTTLSYIKSVGFIKASVNADTVKFEPKICCYADQRVGPFGVLPLAERLEEGRKRKNSPTIVDRSFIELNIASLGKIEQQLFGYSDISPSDIDDLVVAPVVGELGDFIMRH